jgi:tRNA-uridine aminocarboxypropyltransferase
MRDCLCASLPRVRTRTRFVILRHVAERAKASNTARLAGLALENVEIREHGAGEAAAAELDAGSWLLYPEGPPWEPARGVPSQLVVLDGTWAQARRMRQRLPALRGLPILSLPPGHGRDRLRLRRPPRPGAMSTLEAIARAVALLEGEALARPLEELFDRAVRAGKAPV